VVAACDGEVSLWDLASGKKLAVLGGDHINAALAFSPDETLLAISRDNTVELWGLR
jgi:WD40 repeat protein